MNEEVFLKTSLKNTRVSSLRAQRSNLTYDLHKNRVRDCFAGKSTLLAMTEGFEMEVTSKSPKGCYNHETMKIYGLDFTSAPGLKKPITYAQCKLNEDSLFLESLGGLTSFEQFETFLSQPAPWLAGMDFPFGQPRTLVENMGWPQTWKGYVNLVSEMTKHQFVDALTAYCRDRKKGDKHHLRHTDKLANARSPMMLYRVPVGKMFFEGAARLLNSGVSIQPCYVRAGSRIVVEAYPALVARRWIGNRSYKNDMAKQQTSTRKTAREEILHGLRSTDAKTYFGFDVCFNDEHANAFIRDGSADRLDAFLCAIQAGWAYSQRDHNFGIPVDCDPVEGWIVDPGIAVGRIAPASRRICDNPTYAASPKMPGYDSNFPRKNL